ncbi:Tethering factor for nuclear proteasome STS1 [Yarrowia sp. C11]|nr:Tethering factor for nuclear proteasome STS1 [Yarrowia sp. E02]KAG5369700.1 Tethering factor for nuclear proteasome STS1 [Yarrowia sp. C11]
MGSVVPLSSPAWDLNLSAGHNLLGHGSPTPSHSRKRRLSVSPEAGDSHMEHESPSKTPRQQHSQFVHKRARVARQLQSRPLPMSRLLSSLDQKTLVSLLEGICAQDDLVARQVMEVTPKPSVSSAIDTLSRALDQAFALFPYKGDHQNDYAFFRVRPALEEFLAELSDYLSHFLPPNETQVSNSFAFLDQATSLVHRMPQWSSAANNRLKEETYEHIDVAWALVCEEAAKRQRGSLAMSGVGNWLVRLEKHNELAGDRLKSSLHLLKDMLDDQGYRPPNPFASFSGAQQLFTV